MPSTCHQLLTFLLLAVATVRAVDPVYTPPTLSDATGNAADTDSKITWADLPSGEPYAGGSAERVSKGLEPYYNLIHSFIGTVFSKGIPPDIVEKAANGNLGEVPGNYKEYVSYLIGYAICVGIGVLFMLIFPIVACCFCCCRCCGKCGGNMHQSEKDADNSCKKLVFIIILAIIMAFVVTGAVCIYVNNDNTSDAINSIATTSHKNLGDIKTYVNNTLEEVNHIAINNFNFLKDVLFRDLDNVAYLVGLPLRTEIESQTNVRTTLTDAYTLASDLNTANTALADVETKVTSLDTSITDLNTALTASRNAISTIFASCAGSCPTPRPDFNVDTGVDSSALPDLSGVRASMDSAVNTNLTQKIVDAEKELDDIPNRVTTDSNSTVQSLKTTINDLSDEINPVIDEVKNIQNTVVGNNATINLDKVEADINDIGDLIKEYDEYRWQGGLGLACIVLLVVLLAVGGLLCGVFGSCGKTPPSKRGFASNLGGILLMASVGIVCIFSALLMLLTVLTFIAGAPLHAYVCKPITDLDYMDELWQVFNDVKIGKGNYYMGDLVLNNKSIPLTLTSMLRDCKAEKSAMSSFKLDTKFDFEDMLNYSKTLDPEKELDGVTVDFSSVEVYPADLKTQLSEAAKAVDVNFTAFYEELNKPATNISLSTLAGDLDAYAAQPGLPPTEQNDLQTEANNLRLIETTQLAAVVSSLSALNSSVAAMEVAVKNLPTQISSLQTGLNTTENYLKNNAATSVKTLLTTFADRLLNTVDSFTTFTLDAVRNKLGSCVPVWNVYNSLMVHTLCYNIMDTFNGFWFSLGWCIFFFMPGIIFSVKLAKYFRRMNESPSNRVSPAPDEKGGYGQYPQVNGNTNFNAAHFSSAITNTADFVPDSFYGERVDQESHNLDTEKSFAITEGENEEAERDEHETGNSEERKDNVNGLKKAEEGNDKDEEERDEASGKVETVEQFESSLPPVEIFEQSNDISNDVSDTPIQLDTDQKALEQHVESENIDEKEPATDQNLNADDADKNEIENQEETDELEVEAENIETTIQLKDKAENNFTEENKTDFKSEQEPIEIVDMEENDEIKPETSLIHDITVIDVEEAGGDGSERPHSQSSNLTTIDCTGHDVLVMIEN